MPDHKLNGEKTNKTGENSRTQAIKIINLHTHTRFWEKKAEIFERSENQYVQTNNPVKEKAKEQGQKGMIKLFRIGQPKICIPNREL